MVQSEERGACGLYGQKPQDAWISAQEEGFELGIFREVRGR